MPTVDEAKEKWCPLSRIAFQGGTLNRPTYVTAPSLPESVRDTIHGATRCIATECMMWRWFDYRHSDGGCGLANGATS